MSIEQLLADYGITTEQFNELTISKEWSEEQINDLHFIDNELNECYSFTGWPWSK